MSDRTVIINADDLGYDPAVTEGILQAMRGGVVSSATLIVNSPHSERAAALAGGLAVGLHLNLARFAPVWSDFPEDFLVEGTFSEQLAAKLPAEVVERETMAQLERLEALLGRPPTHVDVHKHLHRFPSVLDGLCAAVRNRALPVRSVDEGMRQALRSRGIGTPDQFIGDAGREPYWTLSRLRVALQTLSDGVTELMCHPGYSPQAIPSAYSLQREVELQTFIHPSARALLERCQAKVADFTALRR